MPVADSSSKIYLQLQLLRMLFAVTLVLALTEIFELGTSGFLLSISAIGGIFLGGRTAQRPHGLSRTIFALIALALAGKLALTISSYLLLSLPNGSDYDLTIPRLEDHILLLFLFFSPGFVFTWSFWRFAGTALVELLASTCALLWLLSGHEHYQLDTPQKLSQAAFAFGIEPQHALIALAALFFGSSVAFLALSSVRPLFTPRKVHITSGAPRYLQSITVAALLALFFCGYLYGVNRFYASQLSRASNGVGQKNEEGQSPLGFHSAAGKTKQPAALVRLEGGYEENPWAPMLYLREGALSSFNGHELVTAPLDFDGDVPRVAPGQSFSLPNVSSVGQRKEVIQSVYLLSKHRTVFAIDYPQSVRIIRNPDPNRFSIAYQALSIAPTVKPQDLIGEEVGEISWDPATWKHYLRAPGSEDGDLTQVESSLDLAKESLDERKEDRRYRAVAARFMKEESTPVEKAIAVVQYLSKESIYTRTPGHQLNAGGDPVAPYLFAEEKRGYCVHFAHATVYLLRLLGIPARIATGYLTDLTYAKDGHVLLQMGDRHAWPEVYIRGVGWTVFDVNPAKAENEQALVPDESLLDELMQKLDPAEQFIAPPPLEEKQPSVQEQIMNAVTSRTALFGMFAAIALSLLSLKLYQWFGWRLTRTPSRRTLRSYAASSAILMDLGFPRYPGETRAEYAKRLQHEIGIELQPLTFTQQGILYGHRSSMDPQVLADFTRFKRSLVSNIPRWKLMLAFFNPRSLSKAGRW